MSQPEIKNVYDIRHEDNLYFIFPRDGMINEDKFPGDKQIAVFANLYYFEDLHYYLKYLAGIPESIHIYVISSNKEVLQEAEAFLQNRKKFFAVYKENRGRDISALLIAAKPFFSFYDYACFVHDKKWKREEEKNAIQQWTKDLWENTLSTGQYIWNVINLLNENDSIGLLVPPEPIGEKMPAWYFTFWSDSFEETKKVAEKIGIQAEIVENKPPLTIGTVFWCRTKALKKLTSYPWKYEDFLEEPLPPSGTISHGIERVLAYVVKDAGYNTGMVMTDENAERLLCISQYHFQKVFQILNNMMGVRNLTQLYTYLEKREEFIEYFDKHKKVFLYGVGVVGKSALRYLRFCNCNPSGFIVTDNTFRKECESLPIYGLKDIDEESGIIITVSNQYKNEIVDILQENKINDFIFFEK